MTEPLTAAEIAEMRAQFSNAPTDTVYRLLDELERTREALRVPQVWSRIERDGMAATFAKADGKHGHYETLFAVAAWLLRHRARAVLTRRD